VSASFKTTSVVIPVSTTTPVPASSAGMWAKSSDGLPYWTTTSGSNVAMTGGGGGSGTVTSIIAGTGLSGGTITSSGTIAIDSTVATLTGSQTLTNKTLTAPTINGTVTMGSTPTFSATGGISFTIGDTFSIIDSKADGANSGLYFSSGVAWANSSARLLTLANNFGNVFEVDGKGALTASSARAIGTAQTAGLTLANTTAAALGAQQYSPMDWLYGNGWETGGGTSQVVGYGWQVRPVQGATASGTMDLWRDFNGTKAKAITLDGTAGGESIAIGTTASFANILGAGHTDVTTANTQLRLVTASSGTVYIQNADLWPITDATKAAGGSSTRWSAVHSLNYYVGAGGGAGLGSGSGVISIANATTAPTTNPSGGGVLYVEGGALKYRSAGGTTTTVAPN
jgi:hypothetical protein